MPKKSKGKQRDRANQFNVRLYDGDKAFLYLAGVAKNANSLSAYILNAAIKQAERDLNEPHSMVKTCRIRGAPSGDTQGQPETPPLSVTT